ncbi:sodium:alanine symporter family protein [uncultured Cetobacterium sp.]|uniref:alanine/glycine:cation symporter family protein n=1 Tax=uncultured Cetobacterium sp. TaxID=527638 RepID=UPI00262E18E8|nr:alanine/glycine:cation symporter family protein [uncultured Cetobacterium sp.]
MNLFEHFINQANNFLWSYILIAMLLCLGIYFTIQNNFVQFRYFKEMFKTLIDKSDYDETAVSPFQAFCISAASRVGTGSLAGVAIAISLGGPGSIFWMWIITLIGAASSFVESTLAQIYKTHDKEGFRGGPAYYMEKALKNRKMGIAFSILIIISFGFIFNAVQANTIAYSFATSFASFGISRVFIGVILTLFTTVVIFGGVHRVAKVSEFVVPIMGVAYLAVAIFVIVTNFRELPHMFKIIFQGAFGVKQFTSGGIGAVIMQGIKRGLFSNEAGMGSAPNAAATASTSHPVKQGFIQTLGVFTTTLLICSATAFIIIISNTYNIVGLEGIQLTQKALSSQVGNWGAHFITICILLFAYSSIIGNYYYGETNIDFMSSNKIYLFIYRIFVLVMVMFGSVADAKIVWDLADLFMGSMAILNLIAIYKLSPIVVQCLKDYSSQKKLGLNPVFNINSLSNKDGIECWNEHGEIKYKK